jgi:hypothetical protein
MRRDHLGDAFDHWKGSLFGSLQRVGILTDFVVDPLVSDDGPWQPQDFGLYARLLRVKLRQVLQHEGRPSIGDDRQGYFQAISHTGDLFLDPDTGVATGRVRDRMKYVTPAEIGRLLDSSKKRIVAVYQHVSRVRVPVLLRVGYRGNVVSIAGS